MARRTTGWKLLVVGLLAAGCGGGGSTISWNSQSSSQPSSVPGCGKNMIWNETLRQCQSLLPPAPQFTKLSPASASTKAKAAAIKQQLGANEEPAASSGSTEKTTAEVNRPAKTVAAPSKSPCNDNERWEKKTGRCLKPEARLPQCDAPREVYDYRSQSCRVKTFAEWCDDSESNYEASVTVGKILNALNIHNCQAAAAQLAKTTMLQLPATGQKISDITPIASLTQLTSLYLPNNRIVDISPLAHLRNLEMLSLRDNEIQDISALAKLSKLKRLDIAGNPVTDLSPLKKMKNPVRITPQEKTLGDPQEKTNTNGNGPVLGANPGVPSRG